MRIPSGVVDQYIYFVAVDATDYVTRKTGLATWTVVRSRNGGADTTYTTPTIAEIDAVTMPGVYALLLDEDMTIDAGDQSQEVAIHITHADMAPVTRTFELYRPSVTAGTTIGVTAGAVDTVSTATAVTTVNGLAANTITATAIANGAIDAATFAAGAIDATAIADGAIDAATFAANAITSTVVADDAITAAKIATDAIAADALAASAVDEIMDEVIAGTTTLRQMLRGFAAALLGKASGLGTATAVYRDIADTMPVITATVDASGNRSAVTLDLDDTP